MKIAAIIILYNEYANDSIAYNSLKTQDLDIYFYDNSTEDKYRDVNKKENNYYTQGTNLGLAIAYNYVIEKIKDQYDYIITSDSDTTFPSNYIEVFITEEDGNLVYLPDVFNQGINTYDNPQKLKSKYAMLFHTGYAEKKEIDYYRSINSGVIYASSVFEKVKFNERLFVENIDSEMFDQLHENKIKAKRLNIDLVQDYSCNDKEGFLINGRVKVTYKDQFEYYGKSWYFLSLLMYMKNGFLEKDLLKYLKAYYNIYIRKEKDVNK